MVEDPLTLGSFLPEMTEAQHRKVLRLFGVRVVTRDPKGYECSTEGSSGRTLLLVCVEGSARVSGFAVVWFEEGTPSPLILGPGAERPVSQLPILLEKPRISVGFSPAVRSVRLHSGVYQILLKQVVDNLVNNYKTPTQYIDDILRLYLKGNPVLPTTLQLLNLVDPGWKAYPPQNSFIRDDVLTSRLFKRLVGRRGAILRRGKAVILLDQFPSPFWKYLVRFHFIQLCGKQMHDYVQRVVSAHYVPVSGVDVAIRRMYDRASGKRKMRDQDLEYGRTTLESAPPCIHRALREPLLDMKRFNLAVIVNHVTKVRNLHPDLLLGEIMEEVARSPINKGRSHDISVRITSELKKTGAHADPITCGHRCGTFNGIRCVYDSPLVCIEGRPGAERLDPHTSTIGDIWLFSNPGKRQAFFARSGDDEPA